MEILPEGKNFRLAQKEELPEILAFLEKYLPESLKVKKKKKTVNGGLIVFKAKVSWYKQACPSLGGQKIRFLCLSYERKKILRGANQPPSQDSKCRH